MELLEKLLDDQLDLIDPAYPLRAMNLLYGKGCAFTTFSR